MIKHFQPDYYTKIFVKLVLTLASPHYSSSTPPSPSHSTFFQSTFRLPPPLLFPPNPIAKFSAIRKIQNKKNFVGAPPTSDLPQLYNNYYCL